MKKVFIFFVIISSVFVSASEIKIQEKDFIFKGRKSSIGVEPGITGTDIFIDTGKKKIITGLIPGENLCPQIRIEKERYFATWLNYKKGDVGLCFYDSGSDTSEVIVREEFKFISSMTKLVLLYGRPAFIFFRGIRNSDNEDIFLLDLKDKRLVKLTDTPGNEKVIVVPENIRSGNQKIKLETKTLSRRYLYEIDLSGFRVKKISDEEIKRDIRRAKISVSEKSVNTIVAFGDSITWGKMRMNDLPGEYHPELTYWYKASEFLTENYGRTYTVNLGVNADTSQKGVDRMDTDFQYVDGYYCLVMFGTNDVGSSLFSSASTTENLKWILNNAKDKYGMFPVISTIPPQKKFIPGVQMFKDETEELNTKIVLMAIEEGFPFIDSYSEFMNYKDGWEALLEDIKGNHPNPTGHQIMADLFVPEILSAKPARPEVTVINSGINSIDVNCTENYEFDFDSYEVVFGYSPDNLEFNAKFPTNKFSILKFPIGFKMRDTLYFKIRAVDKDGNGSDFTQVYSSGFSN